MKYLLLIPVFCLLNCWCHAQKSDPGYQKADGCVQEYIQLSRLGPGYSREMSRDIMDQFAALFEKDAFLYWDLYRFTADGFFLPLPVNEYTDRAKKMYDQKQPILDYPRVRIKIMQDGKHAIAYLKKINQIMDSRDNPMFKNRINLRMNINLTREQPLIQNITEDKRLSVVNNIAVGIKYIAWSNVFNSAIDKPDILLASNEQFNEFNMDAGPSFQESAMLEIRLNRERKDGLLFSTGISYSRVRVSSTMISYSKSFPDTLDKTSGNPLSCTTYERSAEVNEKIEITKIEIPLLLRSRITGWMYLKAGTALGYVTASTKVNYKLSRTGGGVVTNLTTHEQYYLDEDHELDQSNYGYFRDKNYHFPKEKFVNKLVLSIHLAAGFEKQLGYFSIGLEPDVSFGLNPLSKRTLPGNYQLNNIAEFNSILESTIMPAFEFAFGIRLLISYLFKN